MSKIYKAFQDNERAIRRVIARYFRRSEDIEDMVQETFVKCFSAEMKEEIRDPKAFLLRVAKNLALAEVKKKVNTITDFMEDSGGSKVYSDTAKVSAEQEVDSKQKFLVFVEAVARLAPKHRDVLMMRKMEGMKFKEIAARLNLSVRAVEKRVAVALVECTEYMQKSGYEPFEFGAAPANTPEEERPKNAIGAGAAEVLRIRPASTPRVREQCDDE